MRKSAGRFGRPAKTTKEIMAEFQEEWDGGEYEEEPGGEEDNGETYDGELVEEYEEPYPEDEEYGGDFEEDVYEEVEEEYEEPEEYDMESSEEEMEEEYDPEPADRKSVV